MTTDPRTWAWGCRGLTPAQRLTLFALSDQADPEQGTCRLSLSALAAQTELSRRGVIKALGELDGRFIDRERGGPGRRTRYRLRWEENVSVLPVHDINVAAGAVLRAFPRLRTDALSIAIATPEPRPTSINPMPTARRSDAGTSSSEAGAPSAPVEASSTPGATGEPGALGHGVPQREAPCSLPTSEEPSAPVHPVSQAVAPRAPTKAPSAPTLVNSVPPNNANNNTMTQDNEKPLVLLATPRPRASTPVQPIPGDWQPSARAYAWADKQGLTKDWVTAQIDEFVIYWSDAGERRKSWEATFINRLKWLNDHRPTHSSRSPDDSPIAHTGLAEKDYARDATPLEDIPWLRDYAVGGGPGRA